MGRPRDEMGRQVNRLNLDGVGTVVGEGPNRMFCGTRRARRVVRETRRLLGRWNRQMGGQQPKNRGEEGNRPGIAFGRLRCGFEGGADVLTSRDLAGRSSGEPEFPVPRWLH